MIRVFKDKELEKFFDGKSSRIPQDISNTLGRKLEMLEAASTIDTLRQPPGNHLELLTGDRDGQYSIRINKRWRLCFIWEDGNVYALELIDYH
jgi:proteic killer suppression protein